MLSRSEITPISIALMLIVTLSGCFNTITKPTRFIGKVIDSSTMQPINDGYLIFLGERFTGIYKYAVSSDTVYLDSEGKFDGTITSDEEGIISISILLVAKKTGISDLLHLDMASTDCSPNSCSNITPGKKYTFDIKVTWPPD